MNIKQFKDSIQVGDAILLLDTTIDINPEVLEKQKKMRYVSYKDTTGFYLKAPEERARGSFCAWPKASELSVRGDIFDITDQAGRRTYQKFHN